MSAENASAPEGETFAEQPAVVESRPGAGNQGARLGNIEILPHQRLKNLDQGPLQAFAARPAGNAASAPLFAYICEPWLIPRMKTAQGIAAIANPQLARLINHGIVHWPLAHAERYVFIYENNLGQPLMKSVAGQGMGWKNEKALTSVIKPIVGVLADLRDADIVHGHINPMNLFDGNSRTVDKVILGDCVAAPASFLQPALFEPIERAMCQPIGRGLGTFEDDMYALGVTLTILLRVRDPLEGLSEDDIIAEKIQQGSYAALTGKERFTGAILELLRGLLYDDRAQRWNIVDVMSWLDGQRLSPKQSSKKVKAARHIQFNEERYNRPVLLAMDLEKNVSQAVQLIDGGEMEQWINRSLEDNLTKGRLEQVIEGSHEQGRNAGYAERLVSRVSMALDPEAPLRYKGIHVTPDGFPLSLLDACLHKKDLGPYVDIINQQLMMNWLSVQTDMRYDVGAIVGKFDSCRAFLRQQGIIYGVERCLYFLVPDAPCYSEKLREFYVLTPEDMLRAFEKIADRPNRPQLFVDRHIAAFLSVRDRKVIDPYLVDLNAPEPYKRVMGNIKVLATIQSRIRSEPFPGVCRWIASLLDVYYARIHDRELRQKIKDKVERLKDTGDIGKMILLLDSQDIKHNDFQDFRQAMVDYGKLREEAHELEKKLAKPETFVREVGREYAAIIASALSGIVIIAFSIIHFTSGG
ncbi:MAG: hypothetical protein HYS17_04135 [Micavibrio aeruginosavorus]|uniref:Protein kinase domain-containing protein n=1 Tax=Micavibrio aeruginosavorus TaxID=349221 RepID=A0A7T5R3P7_9BACT|nr:MAG: hypothetical protein HYS17_04135 [Micavibrio aeruginosavorus]